MGVNVVDGVVGMGGSTIKRVERAGGGVGTRHPQPTGVVLFGKNLHRKRVGRACSSELSANGVRSDCWQG